jgi:hypothetical protein
MAVLECPTPKAPALLLVRTRAQGSKALIPQRQAYHDSDTEAESRGAYTRGGGQSSEDADNGHGSSTPHTQIGYSSCFNELALAGKPNSGQECNPHRGPKIDETNIPPVNGIPLKDAPVDLRT